MALLPHKHVFHSYESVTSLILNSSAQNEGPFPWNSPHFYVVLRFSLECIPEYKDSDYWSLWDLLEKDARVFVGASKSSWNQKYKIPFTQKLSQLFQSPVLLARSTPAPTNELRMARFVEFLLLTVREIKKCTNAKVAILLRKEVNTLGKELTFLYMFLENIPVEIDDGSYEDSLEEIKDLVNQAGSFLHSLFFTVDGTNRARKKMGFEDLLRKFKLVGRKIKARRLDLVSMTTVRGNVITTSPFVLHFLLEDLEDILTRRADLLIGVKDNIPALYKAFTSLRVFLKGTNSDGKNEKLVTETRELAGEAAGYVTNLLLIGDAAPKVKCSNLNSISKIIDRIEVIAAELTEMKKSYDEVAKDATEGVPLETQKPLLVDDAMVGFQHEANEILKQLIGEPESLQIVSIFGMPGLGKTTLAKQLYDNPSVVYHFDRRAWCVVSQTYQRRRMLIDIVTSVSELDIDKILNMPTEKLAEELHKCLKGRRYFIVMDDICDIKAWDDLRRYFPDDGIGSRILFTSRRKDVVLQASPSSMTHGLPFLSEDQCWELLKKVFQNQECPPQLVDIGKKIVALCQGLPLSVVVIAAVLAKMERKESFWNEVAQSMTSHISEDSSEVMHILELSYKHLPEHLKLCFLYFGVFPEDAEIPARKLILYWSAQGFIQKEGNKSLEVSGQEYLKELIDRSLVLIAKRKYDGGVKACSIHDLLHLLCLRIAEKGKFLDLITSGFSFPDPQNATSGNLAFGLNMRSLLGFSPESSFITFRSLKLVRVLQLYDKSDLQGIGFLIHLRYLEVDHCPMSICSLVYLEVLVVRRGGKFHDFLLQMPNLKILDFKGHIQFPYFMKDRAIKSNVQSFSILRFHHGKDESILKNFPHLLKLKCVFVLTTSPSDRNYGYPVIDFLTQLESVNISLDRKVNWFYDVLRLPSSLRKLTMSKFKLSREEMSMLGRLPKLEILKLLHVSVEGTQWNCNDGEFEELRFLKLENPQVVEWNASSEHFPRLEQLVVRNCDVLQAIPSSLGDIPTLQMIRVEMCRKSVVDSAKSIQEEQQDMGNEELKVIIYR